MWNTSSEVCNKEYFNASINKDGMVLTIFHFIDTKVYMMQSFIDDVETTPYGITQVQALLVNDEFTINRKVCVIDSGYDLTHPDLQNEFVTGNGAEGGASRWDEDALWHGTHCTGTIAAIGNNDKGIVGVVRSGTMNLHIVRVFDANASWVWNSGLIQAVSASSFSKFVFPYFV